MKRSDMQYRIATLITLAKITPKGEKPETELETANKILELVQKLGMLPPQRNADLESSTGYAQVWEWNKE